MLLLAVRRIFQPSKSLIAFSCDCLIMMNRHSFLALLSFLFSFMFSVQGLAEDRTLKKNDEKKIRWFVVPNVAFDADDGLGFGVRGELAIDQKGYRPYKHAFVAHAFASLRGYHHHRLRYDRVGIGKDHRLRLTMHLAWRQWLNDGYWGIGNGTLRERDYVGTFDDGDPAKKRYRYTLMQPFFHFTARYRLWGKISLFASLNAKWSVIDTYRDSLLVEDQPFGMDGGLGVILSSGLLYDSREPEANPKKGIFAELSGRASIPLPENAGTFGGVFASIRAYHSLTSWWIVAGRVMSEFLFGDIPFYEMVHWGGSTPITGFGGFETLRGVSFGRFRAPGKFITNLESRFHLLKHKAGKQSLIWQVALFSDLGFVYGADEEEEAKVQADTPIHPSFGGGLRVVYADAFVGRIDAAIGFDPILENDSSVTHATSWGIYVVFDQAF